MSDSSTSGSAFPWPAIILLLAGISGGIVGSVRSPLSSSRPSGDIPEAPPSATSESERAFLWQDPFSAIVDAKKKNATSLEEVLMWGKQRCGSETLVLPVMVTGAGYGVEHERRRRSRYAITSALFSVGYAPRDPQRIGFFHAEKELLDEEPRVADENEEGPKKRKAVALVKGDVDQERIFRVPYERFERASGKFRRVVVLWLPDEMFSVAPLKHLGELVTALEITGEARPSLTILGPGGSGTLDAMITEIGAGVGTVPWKKHISMISPWSTVDPDKLERRLGFSPTGLADHFATARIDFIRSVKTDREICRALVNELNLRNLNRDPRRGGTIVLLSEWDTIYGRAIPASFAEEAEIAMEDVSILQSRYLRELDGVAISGGERENAARTGSAEISRKEMRRATGVGQHDYVRRLANRLTAFDSVERRKRKGKPIRAVGVLGSDVYDKILLLRAMRRHLPDAVFFTTDLDAELMHPEESKWTRNLVVGSSYGLSLKREGYQGEVPPFRESYQTSLFASALCALGRVREEDLPGMDDDIPARIYEIGEFKPIDLSPRDPTAILPEPLGADPESWSVDYFIQALFILLPFLFFAVPIQIMLGYGRGRLKRLKKRCGDEHRTYVRWWKTLTWVTRGLFVFLLAIIMWVGLGSENEEPLTFLNHTNPLNGTSIWTTEGLRLIAAFLAMWFFAWGMIRLSVDERKLSYEFGLEQVYKDVRIDMKLSHRPARRSEDEKAGKVGWLRAACRWVVQVSGAFSRYLMFEPRDPAGILHPRKGDVAMADRTWSYYLFNTDLIRMGFQWHAWSWAALYVLAGGFLVWIWHWPYAPVRGSVSNFADGLFLLISQTTIFALIYLVAWAARRCRGLALCLAHRPTQWPAKLYRRFGFKHASQIPAGKGNYNPLNDWLTIELLSRRTAVVGSLIICPFVVLFVQIFARNSLFDAWTWSTPVIVVYAGTIVIALYFAIGLRRAAEKARRSVVARLDKRQTELKCAAIIAAAGPSDFGLIAKVAPHPGELPDEGRNLVVAGIVSGKLHLRLFDDGGRRVAIDEAASGVDDGRISALKESVQELAEKSESERTREEETAIIERVLAIFRPRIDHDELESLVAWVRVEVESNTRGAFSPFSQNPILVAVLVPFGGVGSLALVDWVVKLAGY